MSIILELYSSWLYSTLHSPSSHIHVLVVGLSLSLFPYTEEGMGQCGMCMCLQSTSTDDTLTDWPLTSHFFLLSLSVQRGAKPKKVLHVSLISLNVDHPTHATSPPRAAACCHTLCMCVCVCTPCQSVHVCCSHQFCLKDFVIQLPRCISIQHVCIEAPVYAERERMDCSRTSAILQNVCLCVYHITKCNVGSRHRVGQESSLQYLD